MVNEYTTFADIRGALGVSEEELSDEDLGLEIHLTNLLEDLEDVSPLALPTWEALPELDDRTANEARYGRLFRLFCSYAVACRLLDSVELFGFLKVADGRASTERPVDAFENLRTNLPAQLARVTALLKAVLALIEPAAPVIPAARTPWISSTGIATDPVTG